MSNAHISTGPQSLPILCSDFEFQCQQELSVSLERQWGLSEKCLSKRVKEKAGGTITNWSQNDVVPGLPFYLRITLCAGDANVLRKIVSCFGWVANDGGGESIGIFSCRCFLSLIPGDNNMARQLAVLCGREIPGPIRSTGEFLWLRFTSDFSVTRAGFNASFHKSNVT